MFLRSWPFRPLTISGPPTAVHGCHVTDRSATTLTVDCHVTNTSMTSSLVYILEVFETSSEKLVNTSKSQDAPHFYIQGLSPNTSYVLVIYSQNDKGRSNNVVLTARSDYATIPIIGANTQTNLNILEHSSGDQNSEEGKN